MAILIDTDAGIDDTAAILLAFCSSQNKSNHRLSKNLSPVVAITVVAGNTKLEAGLANIKSLVSLCKRTRDCTVYAGASGPLMREHGGKEFPVWIGHGADGLGGFSETAAYEDFFNEYVKEGIDDVQVGQENAAVALVNLAKRQQELGDPLRVLALGPLTNIAIAITLDPLLLSRIGKLVIMGGCLHGRGNSSKSSEFNFNFDPHAAHIVFNSASSLNSAVKTASRSAPVEIVPWETCLEHGVSWSFISSLKEYKPYGYLLNMICQVYKRQVDASSKMEGDDDLVVDDGNLDILQRHKTLLSRVSLCDIYAAFALLYPESVLKAVDWHVDIEIEGKSKGSCLFDWMGHSEDTSLSNVRVVLKFDMEWIQKEMSLSFRAA